MRKARQVDLNYLLGWHGHKSRVGWGTRKTTLVSTTILQALPCPKCGFETEETKSLSMSTRTHKVVSPSSYLQTKKSTKATRGIRPPLKVNIFLLHSLAGNRAMNSTEGKMMMRMTKEAMVDLEDMGAMEVGCCLDSYLGQQML